MPEPCTRGSRPTSAASGRISIHAAAVHTLLLVEQPAAHDELLRLIHALVDLGRLIGVNLVEVLVHFLVNGLQALVADGLVVGIECGLHVIHGEIA